MPVLYIKGYACLIYKRICLSPIFKGYVYLTYKRMCLSPI